MSFDNNDHRHDGDNPLCEPGLRKFPLSKLKIIPVSQIPDDSYLVCIGRICTLVSVGEGDQPLAGCYIGCDEFGNCFFTCPTE
ncbi:hypothetical protein J7E38_22710 [Bacillus sp. ISL-35]|uniref:hypothetical protein n=1 Tax=Bacillus sp. ISL-35 TaxID=2819122 RepID=UPI001BE9B34A|nr:hypothetical protein [Bacillus sp. ISL-35]MBT2681774.1 hypothetical protein [Bacillus sp. ISL-35]MBT2706071.1 hypothetical protein [Chryseobacterium sp. ISL-80]